MYLYGQEKTVSVLLMSATPDLTEVADNTKLF
jgi:hypothetical protein